MGIIKATLNAIGGNLADSWEEVIEAQGLSDSTVFAKGVTVRKNDRRNNNKRGTEDVISNGSVIHVGENEFMMLVDGGKIIDYTAEAGYYKVDNSSTPSLFNGQFGDSLKEAFSRIKYAGVTPRKQEAFFINLQEIKNIKFGTRTPVQYFDNFYNAELFLRAHGSYSIRVTDPIKFYKEVISKDAEKVEIEQINEQYLTEFLDALQSAINKMSQDGIRVSFVASQSRELSSYMANELDSEWNNLRGFEVVSCGIASISYDEDSKELINMRNKGAMLGDPGIREGYVQGAVARGFENAGSNPNGATNAFVGMGMGMGAGGNFMATASQTNREQMKEQAGAWTCSCGTKNTGKFCQNCGKQKAQEWTCSCGTKNTGKFCSECGKPKASGEWVCPKCGAKNTGKFCSECGEKQA